MGLLARTALFCALVATLVLFKETRALENLALGKETLRLGTSTGNWHNEPFVTDGDLNSCPQYGSTDFRLNFDQTIGFSLIRIVGRSDTDLPELSVLLSRSWCESAPVVVRERHIQDWYCDTGVTATTVDFRLTRAHVCEILIYTGSAANVALRKPANQSSTFDGTDIYQRPQLTYRAAAGLAVDGAPTKEYKDRTCAVTDWLRTPPGTYDPWWQVNLGAAYDVIRVDIYSRRNAGFPGLAVTVGGQATATVPRIRDVFMSGFLSPPVTASNVNISLSGFGILQLCEVEVFALKACPGNTYGLNCERSCSATCRKDRCNAFNGSCLLGCEPGYTGPDCTSDVDECQSSPCSSHGTCKNTPGSFSCTCDPGYTGQLCDTDIDECDSAPCQNGGTCLDRSNRYICLCQSGYTGANCAKDINECDSSPCKNRATCENLPGSFRCKCISGYTGQLCGTDINECSSGPCRNWATCQDRVNGYNCRCRSGFTGVHCETDIYECESGPCQNNATCRDAVSSYSCSCLAGFNGTHCEINVDECASNPCRFGTCEDGINGYTCVCAPGLQGQLCNQGCGNWTFGVNCRETCGDGCLGSCDSRNGSCSGGCSVGWTGLSCRDECSQGTYGAGCAQRCSGHCLETAGARGQHCHHQTGRCLLQTGCKPGFQGPLCSEPEGSNMGLYIGISVFSILVIGGIIAFVWIIRRKKGRENSEPKSEELAPENKEKAAGLKKSLVSLRDKGVVRYTPSAAASSTLIAAAQLPQVVIAARSNPDHFKDDQLKLPKGLQHPHKVAMKEQNKGKNRYKNICAYDHSRVVLSAPSDQPHSDYINACFIDGYKKPGAFIASQGPTEANVSDFIRMIWEKKVQNIAMVTMPNEEGKMKCVQYWSDTEGKTFGHFTVLVESTVARQHFTARTLRIKPEQGAGRRVAHFLYTAWPDKDVPESPWSLIDFRDKVMTSPNKRGSPILVHCSAGVGRTGTLIALDILLRQLTQEGTVDVYNTVWALRQNRVDMVQTLAQYTFLHEAALVGLCSAGRVVPLEIFSSDPVANIKSKIIEEFRALEQTTQPLHPEDCSVATMSENRAANRDPDILPPDTHVTWLAEEWEGYSKYLNGIVVSNYEGQKRYILTQTPLPDTVVNFWRVVLQFKVKVVVTLDSTQPDLKERVGTYVPVDQRSLQVGPLTLTGLEAERNQGYSVRSIHVALDDDKPETVHEFLVSCWPNEEDAPGDPGQLLGMAQTVLSKTSLKDDAILIHCRDGARRSGLLCALLALLERCRSDGEVAVPHAVGVLKTIRPQAVPTEEQYAFLYAAMLRYAETSQIYQNHTPDQQAGQPEAQGAEDLYGNAEMLKQ